MENAHSLEGKQPRWHLLGAGSLGCLFAASLQRAGVTLELIVRDDVALQQLHANGGITLLRDATRETVAVSATTPNRVRAPITQLMICTKAQQTLAAVAALKSKLAPDALIVLLQNGMGVRELLQHELPCAMILHALSTEGAFRSARFHVTHAGRGETVIGAIEPQQQAAAERVVQVLQCELPITLAPDIKHRLWLKLAVNCVINPLTAIHRCRNGELFKLDTSETIKTAETIVTQLCDEFAHVARAEHIDLSAAQLRDEVYRVMQATANNRSSMLQDIETGHATEIDYINGFIVQRAHYHGIACTQHEYLLTAVHSIESVTPSP